MWQVFLFTPNGLFDRTPKWFVSLCPKDIAVNDQQGATHVFLQRRENYTFGFAALLPYYKYLTHELILLMASLSLIQKLTSLFYKLCPPFRAKWPE